MLSRPRRQSNVFVGVDGEFVCEEGGFASIDTDLFSSTALITSALHRTPSNDVEKNPLFSRNNPNDYSEETKQFIQRCHDKFNNSDKLTEMKLTPQEQAKISRTPVLLHGKKYDLKTVVSFPNVNGMQINPHTSEEFTLFDIKPDYETAKNIQLLIEEMSIKRLAADAREISQNAKTDRTPPNRVRSRL